MSEPNFLDELKRSMDMSICKHCILETYIRSYVETMADEPDQYVKMSEVYHTLKKFLGDED